MKNLYEILVPQADNFGNFIPVAIHNIWDDQVKKIAGGITINRSVKGSWKSPEGHYVTERMIPVTIMCSESEIVEIARMTKQFYHQDAVMFYMVSHNTYII